MGGEEMKRIPTTQYTNLPEKTILSDLSQTLRHIFDLIRSLDPLSTEPK